MQKPITIIKYSPNNYKFKKDWIIYEDKYILVANKPSGLLSVPGRLEQHKICLSSILNDEIGIPLKIVHRLDMDTSGIMLFAKTTQCLSDLSKQFQNREVFKLYNALCEGSLEKKYGNCLLPMRCDWDNRPRQIVDLNNGKACYTKWKTLQQLDSMFYIELIPHTGRSHQLRVHMKMLGHPILGDNLYSNHNSNQKVKSNRLMLHASELRFNHPINKKTITIKVHLDLIKLQLDSLQHLK